jgi:hypothetical protein
MSCTSFSCRWDSDGYYEWDTRCLCLQISKHCSGYKAKVKSQVYPKSISQHVLHEVMEITSSLRSAQITTDFIYIPG